MYYLHKYNIYFLVRAINVQINYMQYFLFYQLFKIDW